MKKNAWLIVLCVLLSVIAILIALNGCSPKQDPLLGPPIPSGQAEITTEIPQPVVRTIPTANGDTVYEANQ